jgi:hypothetical protein
LYYHPCTVNITVSMVYVLQIFSIPKQNFDTVYSFIGSIILKDKECIHRILITITIVIVIMKKDTIPRPHIL